MNPRKMHLGIIYHHLNNVANCCFQRWSYINRIKHFFYYCEVLWCVQIIEYIIARRSYFFVRILLYLKIIIMQTYFKVLNF